MKKAISLLVLIAVVLSIVAVPVSASEYFADVRSFDYYALASKKLSQAGIISGYSDGTFGAERFITRAEMATIICRAMGEENTAKKNMGRTTDLATDVGKNHWASGYVYTAAVKKIINGNGNGLFYPDNIVLLEEAVKMVICAVGLEDEVNNYPDDWAKGYIELAYKYGIMDNVKCYRGNYINRGDVAVMLYQALKDKRPELEMTMDDIYEGYDDSRRYQLTVKMLGCGGIQQTSGMFNVGANVPLYIYPGTEKGFLRWISNAGNLLDPDDPTPLITMPDEDVVVYATFTPDGSEPKGGEHYTLMPDGMFAYVDSSTVNYHEDNNSSYDDSYEDSYDNWYDEEYEEEEKLEISITEEIEYNRMERKVLELVNEERVKHGLKKLYKDPALALSYAATDHCKDMHLRNFFDHVNPDGETPADRIKKYDSNYRTVGENIAKGQTTPEEVMESWMNSPGHRANILSENFHYIGIGVVRYNGVYIWTQCFMGK